MTLICPLNFIKCYKLIWKVIYDLLQTLIIWCTIYETQPFDRSVTLIWPLKETQGHKVNWKIIYDFAYVLHTNIGHSMHRFWDIGLNR